MPSHTDVRIARRVSASVTFRHTFNQRRNLGSLLDAKRPNDSQRSITPARSSEPYGDAELPGQSNRSNTQPALRRFRRLRHDGARAPLKNLRNVPKWFDDSVALRVSSQLFAPGAILLTFHSTHQMVDQHAQAVETTGTEFGTSNGPHSSLVSLSSSLPVGWT